MIITTLLEWGWPPVVLGGAYVTGFTMAAGRVPRIRLPHSKRHYLTLTAHSGLHLCEGCKHHASFHFNHVGRCNEVWINGQGYKEACRCLEYVGIDTLAAVERKEERKALGSSPTPLELEAAAVRHNGFTDKIKSLTEILKD